MLTSEIYKGLNLDMLQLNKVTEFLDYLDSHHKHEGRSVH